jgi:citrate lyase subunit beta/citryl-CoA lyase
MIPRSWLFAPADSPAKMAKAFASGCDAVILDIEDSVAEARKGEARLAVAEFLRAQVGVAGPELWVRINPMSGPHALADLSAVVAARPAGVVVPKPDSGADGVRLAAALGQLEEAAGIGVGSIRILPIATETPMALFQLHSWAGADLGRRLAGLSWGAEDLSSAVGAVTARDEMGELTGLYKIARSLCVAAAAAAGVPAIETVYPDFRNLDGLARYVRDSRRDGYLGMMAIHPSQVAVINSGFTPGEEELAFAQRVVDLFAANPDAATLGLDGKMLDRPHLVQAQRTLARRPA